MVVRPDVDVLGLDEALNRLAASNPEKARLVELRYVGGLIIQEVADITGTAPASVKRQCAVTRAWLYRALSGSDR
jgi:DNA-directed RNA polymerase specialized sigma24 family protein